MKYCETLVAFKEIPDEVSLCINISNCPVHCPACHSKHLWNDVGTPLDESEVERLVNENDGITCVAFMGGDAEQDSVDKLAKFTKEKLGLKVAWYSGRKELSDKVSIENFDYIKLGPYIEEYGSIDKETTNQRMYSVDDGELIDITYKFWEKKAWM